MKKVWTGVSTNYSAVTGPQQSKRMFDAATAAANVEQRSLKSEASVLGADIELQRQVASLDNQQQIKDLEKLKFASKQIENALTSIVVPLRKKQISEEIDKAIGIGQEYQTYKATIKDEAENLKVAYESGNKVALEASMKAMQAHRLGYTKIRDEYMKLSGNGRFHYDAYNAHQLASRAPLAVETYIGEREGEIHTYPDGTQVRLGYDMSANERQRFNRWWLEDVHLAGQNTGGLKEKIWNQVAYRPAWEGLEKQIQDLRVTEHQNNSDLQYSQHKQGLINAIDGIAEANLESFLPTFYGPARYYNSQNGKGGTNPGSQTIDDLHSIVQERIYASADPIAKARELSKKFAEIPIIINGKKTTYAQLHQDKFGANAFMKMGLKQAAQKSRDRKSGEEGSIDSLYAAIDDKKAQVLTNGGVLDNGNTYTLKDELNDIAEIRKKFPNRTEYINSKKSTIAPVYDFADIKTKAEEQNNVLLFEQHKILSETDREKMTARGIVLLPQGETLFAQADPTAYQNEQTWHKTQMSTKWKQYQPNGEKLFNNEAKKVFAWSFNRAQKRAEALYYAQPAGASGNKSEIELLREELDKEYKQMEVEKEVEGAMYYQDPTSGRYITIVEKYLPEAADRRSESAKIMDYTTNPDQVQFETMGANKLHFIGEAQGRLLELQSDGQPTAIVRWLANRYKMDPMEFLNKQRSLFDPGGSLWPQEEALLSEDTDVQNVTNQITTEGQNYLGNPEIPKSSRKVNRILANLNTVPNLRHTYNATVNLQKQGGQLLPENKIRKIRNNSPELKQIIQEDRPFSFGGKTDRYNAYKAETQRLMNSGILDNSPNQLAFKDFNEIRELAKIKRIVLPASDAELNLYLDSPFNRSIRPQLINLKLASTMEQAKYQFPGDQNAQLTYVAEQLGLNPQLFIQLYKQRVGGKK